MTRQSKSKNRYEAWAWGHWAEFIAQLYLNFKGYKILANRHKTKVGEIDLIAYKNKTIIAVEVKARDTFDEGLYAVTRTQQQRITKALSWFLANNKKYQSLDLRFDVIVIKPWSIPLHIKNAWNEGTVNL